MIVCGLFVFVPCAMAVLYFDGSLLLLWLALALLMGARLAGNLIRFASASWQVVGADRAA
jgi:Na+-driven multidrug efflux pump